MSDQIRIVVVDDHTLLRQALCELLRLEADLDIVAEAADGDDAVTMAVRHRPDLMLLDVEMPGMPALDVVDRLRLVAPTTRVLVLTSRRDPVTMQHFLHRGVAGFLHKSAPRQALLTAIRGVREPGGAVTITMPAGGLTAPPTACALSDRECEVLHYAAQAFSNRQIAQRLNIAEGTVKRHMRNIFEKLGAVSRLDAVNRAVAAGHITANTAPY